MRLGLCGLFPGLLPAMASGALAALPYNPTRLFITHYNGEEHLLGFLPSTTSSSTQLQSLNISSHLNSSSVPWKAVSQQPPFLSSDEQVTYVPAIDDNGNLLAFTGDCSSGASSPTLWQYTSKNGLVDQGIWSKQSFTPSSSTIQSNPFFLSTAISFSGSTDPASQSKLYSFGGMCPYAVANQTAWVRDAEYSNTMLSFTPSAGAQTSPYSLTAITSKAPPISEAGFSMTALAPSFSNATDGSQTKQQHFVLLGGHTQTAFINTSQVGLFSLPEETWTFLPVMSPSGSRSDLTRRDGDSEVEPRSGHTAVLTSDGKKLIIFGGWVGDISTPAYPQLAILKLGDGYGGTGDWAWSLADQTGHGLDQGHGIYGHGAVMLPGGIMMIAGGYDILAPTNNRVKRAEPGLSSKTLFLNTTSNAWISNYVNPAASPAATHGSSNKSPSTSDSSSSKKAAIGSGVAVGLLLLIAMAVAFWWYSRRMKKRRTAREKDLRSLAIGAARNSDMGLSGTDSYHGRQDSGDYSVISSAKEGRSSSYPWTSGPSGGSFGEGPGWRDNGGTEAERTGLLVEIPSPTRGLRKSLHTRPRAADRILTSPYDEQRRSGTSGVIHPIDEREEYEDLTESLHKPDMTERDIVSNSPMLDPFGDPRPLSSHPVAEGNNIQSAQEREVQKWVDDWAVAGAALYGRTSSPDKGRTLSNVSESNRSTVSALSASQAPASTVSISRTVSQSSAAFLSSLNPFELPLAHQLSANPARAGAPQSHSPTLIVQRPESTSSSSFATAHTSFHALQSEGETLLPRPNMGTPPDSPTKSRSRASGLLGSMRRAFPILNSHGSESDRESRSPSPPSFLSGGGSNNSSTSPVRQHFEPESLLLHEVGAPQRAASATSTALWRQRKGASDWDETASMRSGDEWDVEAAVERRVVQVMFTVPREKLRVVNGGDLGAGGAASGEGGGAGEDETSETLSVGDGPDDAESVVSTMPEMAREITGKQRMIVD